MLVGMGFDFCFSFHPSPQKADIASLRGFCDALQLSHMAPVAQNHLMPERPQQ